MEHQRIGRRISERRLAKKRRRLWRFGLAMVLGLILVGGANAPSAAPPQEGGRATPAPQEVVASTPFDVPLRLMAEARKACQNVKDYSCTLVKRERINGKLEPEHVISMKVRNNPFSVALVWQSPREQAGQEVVYVAGQNKNTMRVLPKGIASLVGW